MKTAVQIAIENVDQCLNSEDIKAMLEGLLELEKQQIIEANFNGIEIGWKDARDEFVNRKGMINKSTSELAEQYYNETFNHDTTRS